MTDPASTPAEPTAGMPNPGEPAAAEPEAGPRRPRRKHTAVIREMLQLQGLRAADVGCGDGRLVRFLTREGAAVTGVEPSPIQLERARTAEAAGDERYLEGRAEDLPFEDGSLDLVVFFNSLHHVPLPVLELAIKEAGRVLRPGGLLFVMEPLAEGPYFEVMRPIEDETEVRAAAYRAIQKAGDAGFEEICEMIYDAPFSYPSFEACRASALAIDPARAAAFEAQGDALRERFLRAGRRHNDAIWFNQPSRLNLLSKA